jgi:SAM-dependent methyltransferase
MNASVLRVPVDKRGRRSKKAKVCPACGGGDLESFFKLPELPVNCIALSPTREAALNSPKGDIELAFCARCGAVSNLLFDPAKLSYDPSYDNSLHFSPTFQNYTNELARHLIERYGLHGKNIIDVGCGDGKFLSLMCDLGNNRGAGFDPAFLPGRASLQSGLGITIVRDYYSERYGGYAADFVMCRHVLEHIAKPRPFLQSIREAVVGNRGSAIFFELPNAAFVFKNKGIWDIIYEHVLYYSSGALARLFLVSGFDVLNVSDTFNGQYLCLEARVSAQQAGLLGDAASSDLDSVRADVLGFAEQYRSSRKYWEDALRRFASRGSRVAVWGAGAKGAMFVNAFSDIPAIEYVVDVNPHKSGLYVPGTGQKVVGPEFLKEYRPDVLLIANPVYRDEIGRQVLDLGLTVELISI